MSSGEHIVRTNEAQTHVFIIHSGWAFRYTTLPDGRRQILEFLLPGDTIALEAALGCLEKPYQIRAITDLMLCAFTPAAMHELLSRAEVVKNLHQRICERLNQNDRQLISIGRRRASGRLAQLFIEIGDKVGARSLGNAEAFECPLRREHIADALGLTPAHVNRTIAEFERKGVIKVEGRLLRILDRETLVQEATD